MQQNLQPLPPGLKSSEAGDAAQLLGALPALAVLSFTCAILCVSFRITQVIVSSAAFSEKVNLKAIVSHVPNRLLVFLRVQQPVVRKLNFLLNHCFFFPTLYLSIYVVQLWMSTDREHCILSQV